MRRLLVAALALPACADTGQPVRLIDSCPSDLAACVVMTVDVENPAESILQRSEQDAEGFSEFSVGVVGTPTTETGHAPRTVVIRGYTDGMECTWFGQSTVAVIGISATGRTSLLSDQGVIVLEPGSLVIGCPECIAPSDGKGARRSPSWDLGLAGHSAEGLLQTHDGAIAIRTPEGCVVTGDPFTMHSPVECEALESPVPLAIRDGACT